MKIRKAKLSSGQKITVDVSGNSNPGLVSQTGVISTKRQGEPLPKKALRAVIGFIILGFFMIFLTYTALATTVFVIMRADHHNVTVLRNTFPVGAAPQGSIVYVSSLPADQSVLGKVKQAVLGVPAGSVVKIVAGPSADISTNKNQHLVVDGKATSYVGTADKQTLKHQYLAICITGACPEKAAVIVGQDNIIGEVKGYLTLSGIQPVQDTQ